MAAQHKSSTVLFYFIYLAIAIINPIKHITMKKVLPFVAAIALLGAVSCKKEYTCECTYDDGAGSTGSVSATATLSKKDAEAWCDDTQSASVLTGYSCDLK